MILKVASGELNQLRIFGNDWDTFDGTGVRDYIHVLDLAEGHIRAFEFLERNKPNIINLNLGTGIGTSVLDLVKSFERVNKIKIPYEICCPRKGDVPCLVADNRLSRKILDWSPKMTIEDACKNGWKWRSSNPNGYD